jgi:hypothetical protein
MSYKKPEKPRYGCPMYVRSVEDYIVLAENDKQAAELKETVRHVVYTDREASMIKGKGRDVAELCHLAKKVFEDATVMAIKPRTKGDYEGDLK